MIRVDDCLTEAWQDLGGADAAATRAEVWVGLADLLMDHTTDRPHRAMAIAVAALDNAARLYRAAGRDADADRARRRRDGIVHAANKAA